MSPDSHSEEDEQADNLPIQYIESDSYRKFTASGARGGYQPRGDFKIDFYTEYFPDPTDEYYKVSDDEIGGTIDNSDGRVIREKEATAFLSEEKAYSLSIWILAHITGIPMEEIQDVLEENQDRINDEMPDNQTP